MAPPTGVLLKEFVSKNSGHTYQIRRGRDGVEYCTCPGWRNRKTCRHLADWKAGVGERGRVPAAASIFAPGDCVVSVTRPTLCGTIVSYDDDGQPIVRWATGSWQNQIAAGDTTRYDEDDLALDPGGRAAKRAQAEARAIDSAEAQQRDRRAEAAALAKEREERVAVRAADLDRVARIAARRQRVINDFGDDDTGTSKAPAAPKADNALRARMAALTFDDE